VVVLLLLSGVGLVVPWARSVEVAKRARRKPSESDRRTTAFRAHLAHCPSFGEGPMSDTADVQPERRERVFVPHNRRSRERPAGIGSLGWFLRFPTAQLYARGANSGDLPPEATKPDPLRLFSELLNRFWGRRMPGTY